MQTLRRPAFGILILPGLKSLDFHFPPPFPLLLHIITSYFAFRFIIRLGKSFTLFYRVSYYEMLATRLSILYK